jgi:hypothetical protein
MPTISFNAQQKEAEWNDLRIYISGAPVAKIEGIEYNIEQEKEHLYGEGGGVIGIQAGNYKPTGTLTVLKSVLDALNDAAVAAGGKSYLDIEVDIVARWRASSDGTRPLRMDTLIKTQFTGAPRTLKQNDKKMEVAMPFLFTDIASV